MIENLLERRSHTIQARKGVIVGCDQRQEWLLKWWWQHYTKENHFPVTFFDFGLTKSARKWCEEKGNVASFTLPSYFLKHEERFPLPPHWPKRWIETIRSQRRIWFTKALALLQTPYEYTLWLDLDCKCKKSIKSIFDFCSGENSFAVTIDVPETARRWKQVGFLAQSAVGYQTGVIAFSHHSQVLSDWAEHCLLYRDCEYSEQTALSHTIAKKKSKISLLPERYNWLDPKKEHAEAVIVHYGGEEHKIQLIQELI